LNRAMVLMAAFAILAGCTTTLDATGQTLSSVGSEFVQVAHIYEDGCKLGTIKPDACAMFRVFGVKFKASYPLAVGLWNAARAGNDKAVAGKAQEAITELATELTTLAVQGYASFGGGR
jgi:hypothetical protein